MGFTVPKWHIPRFIPFIITMVISHTLTLMHIQVRQSKPPLAAGWAIHPQFFGSILIVIKDIKGRRENKNMKPSTPLACMQTTVQKKYGKVFTWAVFKTLSFLWFSLSITFSKSSAKLRASENQPLHQGYVYVFFKPPAENHLVFQMFLDNTPRDMVIIKWLHQNKSGYECILMGHRIMIE